MDWLIYFSQEQETLSILTPSSPPAKQLASPSTKPNLLLASPSTHTRSSDLPIFPTSFMSPSEPRVNPIPHWAPPQDTQDSVSPCPTAPQKHSWPTPTPTPFLLPPTNILHISHRIQRENGSHVHMNILRGIKWRKDPHLSTSHCTY